MEKHHLKIICDPHNVKTQILSFHKNPDWLLIKKRNQFPETAPPTDSHQNFK